MVGKKAGTQSRGGMGAGGGQGQGGTEGGGEYKGGRRRERFFTQFLSYKLGHESDSK